MSEYKGYTKAMGVASQKYHKEKRESLTLDLAKGVKDAWKEKAKSKGMTVTAYIAWLIENDN